MTSGQVLHGELLARAGQRPATLRSAVRLGGLGRIRLWLSYQRYAFLLGGLPAALLALVLSRWPGAWYLWVPVALIGLWPLRFAVVVYRRFPQKMRATLIAERRLATGRFRPQSVKRYCDDPCFRVVAREILGRAGIRGQERAELLARFTREMHDESHATLVVDHRRGLVHRVDGKTVESIALAQPDRRNNGR